MYNYDFNKSAGWQEEIEASIKKVQAAFGEAEKAAEKAREELNALTRLASKHQLYRTPPFSPLAALDMVLHKAESPSKLYAKGLKDLEHAAKAIKT